jgi:hypothetical protein
VTIRREQKSCVSDILADKYRHAIAMHWVYLEKNHHFACPIIHLIVLTFVDVNLAFNSLICTAAFTHPVEKHILTWLLETH